MKTWDFKIIFILKLSLLYMSEECLPFIGILFRDTHGFLHVSGFHKLSILVVSSFFFDL